MDVQSKQSPRVLVVDDDAGTRHVAERAFQKGGYDVVTAEGSIEALARIQQSTAAFDLYVLDVIMPRMRGTELAERIRQRQPDAKFLYLTGYSDTLFAPGSSVLPGNEAFLEKPASVKGLLESASLLLFGHTRGPAEGQQSV